MYDIYNKCEMHILADKPKPYTNFNISSIKGHYFNILKLHCYSF